MKVRFTTGADGAIEAHVDPADGSLDQALNDAVTSWAPRGAVRPGLSTYWIDKAERGIRDAMAHGLMAPFAAGNVTYLRFDGRDVVAAFDFDADENDAETISVDDLLELLALWRQEVIDRAGASDARASALVDERTARPLGPAS